MHMKAIERNCNNTTIPTHFCFVLSESDFVVARFVFTTNKRAYDKQQ